MIDFVGLHAHSGFSTFDGFGYPNEHIDSAIENGMTALALTDHGTMAGTSYQILHSRKLKESGVDFKPIYGVEAYFQTSIAEWKIVYEKIKQDKKIARQLSSRAETAKAVETDGSANAETIGGLPRYRHLVLLAQNQTGLSNLYRLVSESHNEENFYRRPRLDFDMLRKYNEGIICTSACMSGPLAGIWWEHKDEGEAVVQAAMKTMINTFVEIFGDRFYGEIQWNSIPEQHKINQAILKACRSLGVPVVSTADSHYPSRDSWKDREMYKRLGWLSKGTPKWVKDTSLPESVEEIGYELYPKNGDQMWDSYKKYSQLCDEEYDDDEILKTITLTHWIAHHQIEEFEPDSTIRLPDFVVPKGQTADDALRQLAFKGLKEKQLLSAEYTDRLEYELDVVASQGFSKYFLTMKAIADKANESMATGCARGSAAGSLMAYALNITQVDPVRFGLTFERFMTKGMTSYPDIDFDCSVPALLKQKLAQEWGEFSVVPISNWNTLQLKSLIKDLSKFYEIPFVETNAVTSVMMSEATPLAKQRHGIAAGVYVPTFEEVMEFSSTLQGFLQKHPHIKTHVEAIYGNIRSQSIHAGGCIVADNINEHMPLIRSKGTWTTPWSEGMNVRHLEPLGFIKFDILGLSTLTMIEGAIRHILRRHHGVQEPTFSEIKAFYDKTLHPDIIDFDDAAVWKSVFHNVGSAPGIFQFTQAGMCDFCERVKPDSLDELSAVTSIFRPGPLSMKVHDLFVNAKRGTHDIEWYHPIYKEITEKTYGNIIFQEQIAEIAHRIGKDISRSDGNTIRKLLTKKGTGKEHLLDVFEAKFIEGAGEKGIHLNVAAGIWMAMAEFAKYGFNESHATSYSIISYQCAWLWHHFPAEWIASFLQKEPETRKEKAINIAKQHGYEISALNINTSGTVWEISADGKTLIQPLTSIKGLGDAAIAQVLDNRPFSSAEDLLFRKEITYSKLNKKSLDALCRAGALNKLIDDRFTGMKHFWSACIVERPKNSNKLEENIELFAPEGEFTSEEIIQFKSELTGVFPMSLVMSGAMLQRLQDRYIPPISEFDSLLGVCWFIPRKVIQKKTKKGKDYWILEVIDSNNEQTRIRCWGVKPEKDRISLNTPYMAKLQYSQKWGFSTRSMYHNFKCLGN
jgi:DNA polymerase-3 subunit alpha